MKIYPINTALKRDTAVILARLQALLREESSEAYIVGSIVRNLVAGHDRADIDIAVDGNALVIGKRLADKFNAHYVVLDDTFGVARLLPRDDDTWQIDIVTLQGTLEQDLLRRDFSINALAINMAQMQLQESSINATILDVCNGMQDLQNKTIRAASEQAFRDDPIRLLRGVRLSSELNFTIDEQTSALMQREHALISTASPERVREELLRLFALTDTYNSVVLMHHLGILAAIIPRLAPTLHMEQSTEHTWDVFHHSARSIDAFDFLCRRAGWEFYSADVLADVPWEDSVKSYFDTIVSPPATRLVLTKLAALLHDIAKPTTKIINDAGRIRFYRHAQQGAPIAAAILERLRFSHSEIKFIETIVRHHLHPVQLAEPGGTPSKRAVYRFCRDLEDAGIATLYFSLADHLATRGPNLESADWGWHAGIVRQIIDEYEKDTPPDKMPLLLDGNELQSEFGLKPGKQLGQLLEELREAQAAGEISTRQQGLDYIKKLLEESTLSSEAGAS